MWASFEYIKMYKISKASAFKGYNIKTSGLEGFQQMETLWKDYINNINLILFTWHGGALVAYL